WEVGTWKLIRQLSGHEWTVSGLDISADLRFLISSGIIEDRYLKLWDLTTNTVEMLADMDKGYRNCAISPNGELFAFVWVIYDLKNKKVLLEFRKHNMFCDFFQFSSDGKFLLCVKSPHPLEIMMGNRDFKGGVYIVPLTTPEITVQKLNVASESPTLQLWLARISPNNRYIVVASEDAQHFLEIIEVKSGKNVESFDLALYPEITKALPGSYCLENGSYVKRDKLPHWEAFTVSENGQIFLGIKQLIFTITPETDLSKTEIYPLIDPEISNPDQEHQILIDGHLYDTNKYLKIYDKYNLPENELQGLLRLALNGSFIRRFNSNSPSGCLFKMEAIVGKIDLIEKKSVHLGEDRKHIVEFHYDDEEWPYDKKGDYFPTPQEFPYMEIIRINTNPPLPNNIGDFKHLRILDLFGCTCPLPVTIAQMPNLEYVDGMFSRGFPQAMQHRVYGCAIISPLEVEALQDWGRVMLENIVSTRYPRNLEEEVPFFVPLNQHVDRLVLRYYGDLSDYGYEEREEIQDILDSTPFPPSSCNFKWLTRVEIPDLDLINFPLEIQAWSKLEELTISIKCMSVPSWLTKMSALQKLVVKGNGIIDIPLQLPPQCEFSWHPAYKLYYREKSLPEIAKLCNTSREKNYTPTLGKLEDRSIDPSRFAEGSPIRIRLEEEQEKIRTTVLQFLDLRCCDLSPDDLAQRDMKAITHLYLRHNHIFTLRQFPLVSKNLMVLDLGFNHLQNLVGLPTSLPAKCLLLLDGNPLRSLSGLPKNVFKRTIVLNFWGKRNQEYPLIPHIKTLLSQVYEERSYSIGSSISVLMRDFEYGEEEYIEGNEEGLRFEEEIVEQIIQYYEETTQIMVDQVISNPTSISEKICERLCYEGGYEERQMLEPHLPPNHPILVAIDIRLQVDTYKGYSILL
ncbi:MAG: hypothetical protein ACTSVZ_06330, partial [Promethearchaeota archaeon]